MGFSPAGNFFVLLLSQNPGKAIPLEVLAA
jgi:hypothetical protein